MFYFIKNSIDTNMWPVLVTLFFVPFKELNKIKITQLKVQIQL